MVYLGEIKLAYKYRYVIMSISNKQNKPLLRATTMTAVLAELAPFLNTQKDGIVYLPIKNSWVRRLMKPHHRIDLMTVSGMDYEQLIAMQVMPRKMVMASKNELTHYLSGIEGNTREYYLEYASSLNVAGVAKMSDKGYGLLYDALSYEGYVFADILRNLEHSVKCWHECTVSELVKKFNINTDGMNEQAAREAVLGYIETNPWFTYRQSYLVNSKSLILYSEI